MSRNTVVAHLVEYFILPSVIVSAGCGSSDDSAAKSGAAGSGGTVNVGGASAGGAIGNGGSDAGGGGKEAGMGGQAGSAGSASAIGTVEPKSGECADGPGALPNTTCQMLTVRANDVDPIDVEVRITPPAAGSSPLGTVVFGTGGPGTTFYDHDDTSLAMMTKLAEEGFRIVQRRWMTQWELGPGGMGAVAGRYATLLTWIHDTIHQEGGFCATGNSGGSSEVSYALSRYGRGAILDLAIPSGGPPMARMDNGCLVGDADWMTQCQNNLANQQCDGQKLGCTLPTSPTGNIDAAYTPDTPCADGVETQDPKLREQLGELLRSDSVVALDAVLAYPKTRVAFFLGTLDCGGGASFGPLFYDAITTEKAITYVADTPHAVYSTENGANAIHDELMANCKPRH